MTICVESSNNEKNAMGWSIYVGPTSFDKTLPVGEWELSGIFIPGWVRPPKAANRTDWHHNYAPGTHSRGPHHPHLGSSQGYIDRELMTSGNAQISQRGACPENFAKPVSIGRLTALKSRVGLNKEFRTWARVSRSRKIGRICLCNRTAG